MTCFVSSCTIAITSQPDDDKFVIDPSTKTAAESPANVVLAWDQKDNQLLQHYTTKYKLITAIPSATQEEDLARATKLGKDYSARILAFSKEVVSKKITYQSNLSSETVKP